MDRAESAISQAWTAEAFLATDQRAFGDAWRYELVDGRVIAHAAPSPDHGAILSLLNAALVSRLRGRRDGCRAESGSGAAPARQQRNTARIPDAMVRCGEHPRVVFEIVSPSELRAWRARNRKRRDEQDTEGVQEIVELYQAEAAAHVYRREADGAWSFEAIDGPEAVLTLRSVGIEIPLSELYETVDLPSGETIEDEPA
jgi:Uma2 family endonuclease